MMNTMRIVLTLAWIRFALFRLLRGRAPALRAVLEPSRSGGPPTPWATVGRPMCFGGAPDAGSSCTDLAPVLYVAAPRVRARAHPSAIIVATSHGPRGWWLRQPDAPVVTGPTVGVFGGRRLARGLVGSAPCL